MTPRLSTSKKWTELPKELCQQIQEVFVSTFEDAAKRGEILFEGRIYSNELLVRLGFLEKGRLAQINFEVSMDFNPQKQNGLELIHFAVDCAASLMNEYFNSEEDLDQFPRQWKDIEFEKKKAFIQVSTVNTKLESEADRLLGIADDSLVQGTEEEDEEAVITMLGLNKDDFSEEGSEDDFTDDEADDQDDDNDPSKKTIH